MKKRLFFRVRRKIIASQNLNAPGGKLLCFSPYMHEVRPSVVASAVRIEMTTLMIVFHVSRLFSTDISI